MVKNLILPALILCILPIVDVLLEANGIITAEQKINFELLEMAISLTLFLLLMWWIKKNYYPDGINFKQIFINGLLTSLFTALIFSLFIFIYITYINPEFVDVLKRISKIRIQTDIEGNANTLKVNKIMVFFQTPLALIIILFVNSLFGGAFLSLIAALIFRTREKNIS